MKPLLEYINDSNHKSLTNFQKEFKEEIENIISHKDRLKTYMTLFICMDEITSVLSKLNTEDFIKDVIEDNKNKIDEYNKILSALNAQFKSDNDIRSILKKEKEHLIDEKIEEIKDCLAKSEEQIKRMILIQDKKSISDIYDK